MRSQIYVSCQSVTHTEQALSSTLKAINKGKSYRTVSEMYNIPRSTLHNYYNGKVQFGSKPDPNPYLPFEEEDKCRRIGFPHTKKEVFAIVERVLEK